MTNSDHKHAEIEELIERFSNNEKPRTDHYLAAFIHCFNHQQFYQAHDVLELHWLDERHRTSHADLYKGLIQLAAAYVHLKLNYEFPTHHAHSRRIAPAVRLLKRSQELMHDELVRYSDFDLSEAIQLSKQTLDILERNNEKINPWTPENSPQLKVPQKLKN